MEISEGIDKSNFNAGVKIFLKPELEVKSVSR